VWPDWGEISPFGQFFQKKLPKNNQVDTKLGHVLVKLPFSN
jgi:hypothetical protein